MRRHRGKFRLAVLAVSACAVTAIASLGSAGSAMALTCESGGYGSGAAIVGEAITKVWLTSGGWGKNTSCSPFPTITYTGTSSGEGLNEFGNKTGVLNEEEDTVASKSGSSIVDTAGKALDWFVATEEPPSQGELNNAIAASGDLHNNLEEITVPVAQVPLAILLSLPTACKITTGTPVEIDGKTLVQAWEATRSAEPANNDPGGIAAQGGYAAATWGALFTQLGYTKVAAEGELTKAGQFFDGGGASGCAQAITLEGRSSEAGATFTFKDYLDEDNDQLLYNTKSKTFATENLWDGFVSGYPSWPVNVISTGNKKDSELVKKVTETPGSLTYAATADAVSSKNGGFTHSATSSTFGGSAAHQIVYALIQNNVGQLAQAEAEKVSPPASEYADPVGAGTAGNCESDKTINADRHTPYSIVDTWAGISTADPNIGVDDTSSTWYPICSLAYVLAWHHYAAANLFPSGPHTEIGNSVRDFLTYAGAGVGQSEVKSDYYDATPILASPQWRFFVEAEIAEIK